MFEKWKKKLASGKIKKQAQLLKEIMTESKLQLVVKDRYGISYEIKPEYNLRHFLTHNTYFDGHIAELIGGLKAKGRVKVAFDVGANKGMTAAFLASFVDTVIAFEPDDQNIANLKHTLSLNGAQNVELIPKAVSDKNGKVNFFIAPGDAHHSLGIAHPGQTESKVKTVDCVTLDSFCKERGIERIDILKVDVEGFETAVFLGASELLKNKQIGNILFEVSMGVMDRLGFDPAGPIQILEANDYHITNTSGRVLSADEIIKHGAQDLLATPR